MTNQDGASDPLAAIQSQLDRMDIRFDRMDTKLAGIYDPLQWQGEMLKFHGLHFGRLEATLVEHGDMLKAHGNLLKAHDARFDQVDARFDQVDARFDQIDDRFDQVDETLQKILARLDAPRS